MKIRLISTLTLALMFCHFPIRADDKPAAAPAKAPEAPAPPPMPKQEPSFVSPVGSIENRLKQLHETVSLSAEQEAKIKAVLMKNDAAMRAAVAAFRASHTKEDRQKLSALMKAQNVEINALLSDAQKNRGLTAQNAIPTAREFRPATGSSRAIQGAPPPAAQTTPATKQPTP